MASSRYFRFWVPFCRSTIAALLLVLLPGPAFAFAKTPELSAIEVYPTADGQAYVQITGFALNGKDEVHLCSGVQTINKGSYGKLPRVPLGPGMSLERAKNGELLLSRVGGAPECVVPVGVKLEKDEGETPAELAEKTEVQGQIAAKSISSTVAIPPIAPGVKIVLVPTLDTELAESLLAQRSGTIAAWKTYLGRYPTGPHASDAKASLAILYAKKGQADLADYQASLAGAQSNYDRLQAAEMALDSAMLNTVGTPDTEALATEIREEVSKLNAKGHAEIEQYRDAMQKQVSGYTHLVIAEAISRQTLGLAPRSPETASLSQACLQERNMLDHRLVDFANKLSAKRPDEAYEAIKPISFLASEYPKVQDCLNALYSYYVEEAKKDDAKSDYDSEVAAFQNAKKIKATPEIEDLLHTSQAKAEEGRDKAAVANAINKSNGAEEDKDFVTAYEVLDDLTPSQKKQVAERLDSLKDRFVPAASNMARDLQRTHLPIKGLTDEAAIQHAYSLVSRCYALTNEPGYSDRAEALGQYLSNYYLGQAKHYLERPDGAGAGLARAYLIEASQLKGADANAIQEEMTVARSTYQLRSKLAILVSFRARTPGREAADFAAQLTESVAAGLESSGLKIKVVRPAEETKLRPNFQLVGDVQQSFSNIPENHPEPSKYRSAEQNQSPDWNAANAELDHANDTLETARRALQGAEASGKKHQIEEAQRQTDDAQKKVDAARAKLNSIPKFSQGSTERPYNYTEQINHLKAAVELGFLIQDNSGNIIVPSASIPKTLEQSFTVLRDVKPDDSMGVHAGGEVPSEAQFLEKVQSAARDELLMQAKEKVANLPALTLQDADHKAAEANNDEAAELYMLYLDSTESQDTPERRRAQRFLLDNFNFRAYGESPKA